MAASFEMIRADSLLGTRFSTSIMQITLGTFEALIGNLTLSSLDGRFCTERMGSRGIGMELEGETERGE